MKYRKIFALLLAAATLFSLAACGETAAGPEATPDPALDESAATVSGQTLTFAGAADDVFSLSLDYEESLNPVKTQSTLNQLVDCLVYDRLFEVDENFNVTSRILSDWYYSKNEDSAGVWVLKVREGIQMHDGSTLTAQDVYTLCDNLFRFPALERIDLTGCGLTAEQIKAVRSASGAVTVYELELFGKTVSTDALELDFSGIRMGLSGAAVIEEALGEFPLLEKVVLCDCGISNEDMAALNDRHENVRFVWRVYFSEFSLRTDDTNFIAARVRNEFPIYSYELEVLKYCPDLQALDLGHKNITSLDFLRYVPHLKYLIIVENDVNDITPIGELQELTYLEMFWKKCEDISPLQNCKALTDLNISYIYCRPAKCLETLVNMPQLERLWYCGNNLNAEQLEELQTALPDTEMYLAAHGEPTGSTWREHPHYFEMRDFFGMYYMAGGTNGVDENGNQIIITG